MADWADVEVERIGQELDHTPHKDNAAYVEHFERLISKSLRDAYQRGMLEANMRSGSIMEPGQMSQGFGRRLRDPWG